MGRNRWRSAVSAGALLFGVCALLFLQAFVNGFVHSLSDDVVLGHLGAIQVHRAGYLDAEEERLALDLPDDPALADRLRAAPGVRAVTRRIDFEGQLGNGAVAALFLATAIDPRAEYEVCPRRRERVARGQAAIGPGDAAAVLVMPAFADGLGAGRGATLIASAATKDGRTNALDVTLHGLLADQGGLGAERAIVVPLALAQDLLGMRGRVTAYVLRVDDLQRVDETAAALRSSLGAGYQITTFRDFPGIRDAIDRMAFVMLFVALIMSVLVAAGIVNTVLMSVFERVREIGTMMAIGVRRRQVVGLFLLESAVLGLGGAVGGALLGLGILRLLAGGIEFPATWAAGALVVVPRVGWRFVVAVVLGATIVAVVAALYPARKAAGLRPVEALRAT